MYAEHICAQLQSFVVEPRPCYKFFMDNSIASRSAAVEQFAGKWGIFMRFCKAYALSDNRIVERNHRTIERIAE